MSPSRALTSPLHLACVDGPDRGKIIDLHKAVQIGRLGTLPLRDPCTPRQSHEVLPSRHGHKPHATVKEINGTRVQKLGIGARKRIGSNVWELRERPRDTHWPLPPGKTRMSGKVMRFMPLIFIIFGLWRWLHLPGGTIFAVLASIFLLAWTIFLCFKARKALKFDPAFLALATLASATLTPTGGSKQTRIWSNYVGGKAIEVQRGETISTVGKDAEGEALWFGAQLSLAFGLPLFVGNQSSADPRPPTTPCIWIKSPGDKGLPAAGSTTVAWADSIRLAPDQSNKVIPASKGLAPGWFTIQKENDNLPTFVHAQDIDLDLSLDAINARWALRNRSLKVPVGKSLAGTYFLDLAEVGPHALIAGATGGGKSVGLQTWLFALATHLSPRDLQFVLIDYKGGAGLGTLQSLPHTVQFATDLEAAETAWLLRRLKQVMSDRKTCLRENGFRDLRDFEAASRNAPPRLIIVIDEFQALGEDHPEFLDTLGRLAAQGRSLGIHLVLSTQRPGPVVTQTLRATLDLRIAFRCKELSDSHSVIGNDKAVNLPRQPGLCIIGDETVQFAAIEPTALPISQATQTPWPTPLPPQSHHSPGTFERDGSLSALPWDGAPLLIAGPAGSGPDIDGTARAIASVEAQCRKLPLTHLSCDLPVGEIAAYLTEATNTPQVLLITDLSAVMRELESAGTGPGASTMLARIISTAKTSGVILIATDSGGHAKNSQFGTKLLRLPNSGAWSDPTILRLSPPLPTFGMSTGDLPAKEEVTSAHPGRFLAIGFPETDICAVQSPTNGPPIIMPTRKPADASNADVVVGDIGLAQSIGAEHFPSEQWFKALSETGKTIFISMPALDCLRHLSQRSPRDELWIKARFPYEQNDGILITDGHPKWATIPQL